MKTQKFDRQTLINKVKSKDEFLTKEESDWLGPLTNRDLAPITGDSFMDKMITKDMKSFRIVDKYLKSCGIYAIVTLVENKIYINAKKQDKSAISIALKHAIGSFSIKKDSNEFICSFNESEVFVSGLMNK